MGMRRNNLTPSAKRATKEVAVGFASVAILAGLLVSPYGVTRAQAAQDAAVTEAVADQHIGSDEVSVSEAAARAETAEAASVPDEGTVADGQLIVETFPGVDDSVVLATAIEGTGMRVAEQLMPPCDGFGGMYLVKVPATLELNEARAHLLMNTQIQSAGYDVIMQADGEDGDGTLQAEATNPNPYANDPGLATKWEDDPSFLNFQGTWDTAYASGWRDSSNVTVAVLDSGITQTHPDLQQNIIATYDATAKQSGMADMLSNGHGTAVAGIISARTGNGIGTASLAYNARLLPIQVFSRQGSTTGALFSDIYRGFQWLLATGSDGKTPAEKYNVKVINLSAGCPTTLTPAGPDADNIKNAINRMWQEGIVVVNSMGNTWNYTETVNGQTVNKTINVPYDHWPTSQTNCVGVIALERESSSSTVVKREPDSNYNLSSGNIVAKVSAPGDSIYTTSKSGSYRSDFTGTSSAAPQVSSLLALMYSIYPDMTPQQATTALYNNTKPTKENNVVYTGYGMINPKAAVTDVIALKEETLPSAFDLKWLTCDVAGQPYSSFNPQVYSYQINCSAAPSADDMAVEFHGVPALWTETEVLPPVESSNTNAATGVTTHSITRTFKFTSNKNNPYLGTPISRSYAFKFVWTTQEPDPDAEKVGLLSNMQASVNGTALSGFSYRTLNYSKNYGRIAVTQQLPSAVNITGVPTDSWTVGPVTVVTDSDVPSVLNDGTTTGTRTKVLRYTLTSTENGSNGYPLTRQYTFTFTGNYVDDSTRYTKVLENVKLLIDGQEYSKFNSAQSSYAIEKADQDAFNSISAPSFDPSTLPAGWTQSATGPETGSETIDKGNGKSIRRDSKRYVLTLSKGNAKMYYSVKFYHDTEIATPSGEDSGNGGDNGGSSDNGSGTDSGSQGQQGSQQQGGQQGTQQAPAQQGGTATAPANGNGSNGNGTSNGTQQGNSGQTGSRNATAGSTLQQTGDAVAPIAVAVIAGAVVASVAVSKRKARNEA